MKRSELILGFAKVPVDIAMILAAFALAYFLRVDIGVVPAFSDVGLMSYLWYSFYLIPVWMLLLALNGLYNFKRNFILRQDLYHILNASSTAMLFLIVGIFFSRTFFFSRLILAFTWVLSIITLLAGRLLLNKIETIFYQYGIGIHRVLLIGKNESALKINSYYASKQKLGYRVLGTLTTDGEGNGNGIPVLGPVSNLSTIIKSKNIDEIILTETKLSKEKILEIIQIATDQSITFRYVPDILAILTSNVTTGLIGSMPVMELHSIPLDGWGRIVKRILDIILSSFAVIVAFPIMFLVAIGIKSTSRGPLIYRHLRVGRDGKEFYFFKFRSMYQEKCDYKKGGSKWTTECDNSRRVTPFGKFIRKTSLDELPQFFNVLKGDMSFVGPRPEQPKFVQKFEKDIPEYSKRHRVRSGITGWAQVNGLKGDTSIRERVRYDIYYIENWSIWFDLYIILKTVKLIIKEALFGKVEYKN
ncbi:MAG: undecaprenyl-phosphate glucose phosphotransferase [Patescibacteria group bacterium]